MDEEGFINYLKEVNKAQNIRRYTRQIKNFENYLSEHKDNKLLEEVSVKDLEDFVEWGRDTVDNMYQRMWGIRSYYRYIEREALEYTCSQLMQKIRLDSFSLKDFMNVNKEYAKKLKK